jgi:hypothetical protein
MEPHQPWQQEDQLEAESAVSEHANRVARFEGRASEGLAGHAGFCIPEREARLLGPVVRDQIREAVVVHVLRVPALLVHGCSSAGAEVQRRHIDVRHVEVARAEDGHRDDAATHRVDGVGVPGGLDVELRAMGRLAQVEENRHLVAAGIGGDEVGDAVAVEVGHGDAESAGAGGKLAAGKQRSRTRLPSRQQRGQTTGQPEGASAQLATARSSLHGSLPLVVQPRSLALVSKLEEVRGAVGTSEARMAESAESARGDLQVSAPRGEPILHQPPRQRQAAIAGASEEADRPGPGGPCCDIFDRCDDASRVAVRCEIAYPRPHFPGDPPVCRGGREPRIPARRASRARWIVSRPSAQPMLPMYGRCRCSSAKSMP